MVLTGWKEIAKYLGCSVRTVQRWEASGLPILRPTPGLRAHVVAYPKQLDTWMKRSDHRFPEMVNLQTEIERTRQLLLDLLQHRQQMRQRLDELRRELAALRTRHRNH